MSDIIDIDTIFEYNKMMNCQTLHPLVSVIDMSKAKPMSHFLHRFGFYTIFLKDVKCGDLRYGRHYYDYQEGTLVFLSPGQVIGLEDNGEVFQPKGYALVFHPDLIHSSSLNKKMKEYSFFSYDSYEALHISEQERQTVLDCLNKIDTELHHAIDKHTKTLVIANIELLLDYCVRFYDRQFITRSEENKGILARFENILNEYINSEKTETLGLPSVAYCAEKLHISSNYLGDLIKKETGKTAQEHIQYHLIDVAKGMIFEPDKSISQIAYELGFKYPQHFTRLFKKRVGVSPVQYRRENN